MLANYRLTTAICPAQVRDYLPNSPVPTNYIASGGLGLDTPAKTIDEAGPLAGAYRYDRPTPNSVRRSTNSEKRRDGRAVRLPRGIFGYIDRARRKRPESSCRLQ